MHALQDATRVSQKIVLVNLRCLSRIRSAEEDARCVALVLGGTLGGFRGALGNKGKVDPIYHLLGTAVGWGGNPDKDAIDAGGDPPKNDGKTVDRLTVRDVPVDGFWSCSSAYNVVRRVLPEEQPGRVTTRKKT